MHDPRTATTFVLGPVVVAYLLACGGWLAYDRFAGLRCSEPPAPRSERPRLDLLLALAAAAGILALGAVYRQGGLLPTGSGWIGRGAWMVDNLIIFSPIAAVLLLRRQGLDTLFLSATRLPEKIGLGLGLGVISLALYSAMRGETDLIASRLASALDADKLVNFLPVFLEGVAVAFAFVRFRWLVGTLVATLVPAVVFAAAHVPGQLADERALAYMAVFFVFNSVLTGTVFLTIARSRDVVWIGLVHYLLDVAIEAV